MADKKKRNSEHHRGYIWGQQCYFWHNVTDFNRLALHCLEANHCAVNVGTSVIVSLSEDL